MRNFTAVAKQGAINRRFAIYMRYYLCVTLGSPFSAVNLTLDHKPEPIPMYVHDLKLLIILQVFPELGDVNIHTAAIEIGIATPDLFQCLFAG